LTRIARLVLALPLYALSYLLFIPLFVAGCVLAAVIGVVFMALLVPLVVVLLIVGLFRRDAFGDFFDWLGEHNPGSGSRLKFAARPAAGRFRSTRSARASYITSCSTARAAEPPTTSRRRGSLSLNHDPPDADWR
jgi:hypothetical protein